MTDNEKQNIPLKFYGNGDLADNWHAATAIAKIEASPDYPPSNLIDALELFNASRFIDAGFIPLAYEPDAVAQIRQKASAAHSSALQFVGRLDLTQDLDTEAKLPYFYRQDLLELLALTGKYKNTPASTMLSALKDVGLRVSDFVGSAALVEAYDAELRARLIDDPMNAELVLSHYFATDVRHTTHLPASLSGSDLETLFDQYVTRPDANANHLQLIVKARPSPKCGITPQLRLKAADRQEEAWEDIRTNGSIMRFGAEVRFSDETSIQEQAEYNDGTETRTYSLKYLDETLDAPSILNNYQHLFKFADDQVLLTTPAFPEELGTLERVIGVTGKEHYRTGIVFNSKDLLSLGQVYAYEGYLQRNNIRTEEIIAWFCKDYLPQEFEIDGFSFAPSSATSSYLERVRHLFAELESLAHQFKLYATNGRVDRRLLMFSSDGLDYHKLGSLVKNKYAYATKNAEMQGVLFALFSDQSRLTYINDELSADNMASLITRNRVDIADLASYQRPVAEDLLRLDVLAERDGRLVFANVNQATLLSTVFYRSVVARHRLSSSEQLVLDGLVERDWMNMRSTLLSEPEASYFNYWLNYAEFSDGPALRNKYLHGSQNPTDSEDAHFETYLRALRLIVALVIKINDDIESASSLKDSDPATAED